jgi:hypothetical protein
MEHCRAKRGFFSLRDCGEMAVKQCALCGRPVCSMHLSPQSGFTNCLDCEGRQSERQALQPTQQQQQQQQASPDQPLTDPGWSYRYRNGYYSRSGYAPIYTGSHYDSYYDRYDTRSFDSNMASSGPSTASWGDDVKGGTGVGDS